MKYQSELVLKIKTELGEAPLWKRENKCLYFVDILGKKLYSYKEDVKKLQIFEMPSAISCFAFGDSGLIYVMLEDGLYSFDEETEELKFISKPLDLDEKHRFNDGKCDPSGRFYVGSMEKIYTHQTGSLYFVDHEFNFNKVLHHEFIVPNGLSWNEKLQKFYHVDTIKGNVNSYNYDSNTGELSSKATIIHFDEESGAPDGMTIDEEGMLWIANWDAYKVTRWNSETGELLDEISVPCEKVTSVAFGGINYDELYITTGSLENSKGELSGSVFKAKVKVKGQLLHTFKTN